MLCDDILADKKLPVHYPGFDRVQRALVSAHKYVLAPDFTMAADGLVDNFKELERIAPFCRLPAQNCWFEFAQNDRPTFSAAPVHFEEYQTKPKRVGFLTYANDPNKLWEWNTVLIWSLVAPRYGIENNASSIIIKYNTKEAIGASDINLGQYIQIGIAPFAPDVNVNLLETNQEFLKLMQSDWGAEIRYFIGVLGLLNARNVMEAQTVDHTDYNKKRAKQGKPPFCSHTVLKIRAMHRRSLTGVRGRGTPADVREHFVSGHWKARRTGLFWWNPFWRGNPERGQVSHDYEITT